VLNKLDEKLSLLCLAILVVLLAVHGDGLSSDLLEFSILVSIVQKTSLILYSFQKSHLIVTSNKR